MKHYKFKKIIMTASITLTNALCMQQAEKPMIDETLIQELEVNFYQLFHIIKSYGNKDSKMTY